MRIATTAALAATLCLCACGEKAVDKPTTAATGAPALKGMPIEAGRKGAETGRMLSVQGRWKGRDMPGLPKRHIELDLAGTGEYALDLVGEENGRTAIYASSRGRLSWREDGVMEGRGDAKGPLAPYAKWIAGFQGPKTMTLRNGDGDQDLHKAE
jgi:hypothetical protein